MRNRIQLNEHRTIELEEYREKTYQPDNPRLRYAVENVDGQFIGTGGCLQPFWMNAPGVHHLWIVVDPDWRGRGIGQALLPRFEAYGREQGVEKLPILRLNHKLGCQKRPGWTQREKML